MSARLLRSLTDENQDLQKQIGCMNGIFQLFDRHHFLNGRRTNSHSHKRLPAGQNGNRATQLDGAVQRATEKDRKKSVKEKERVSKESSKTSFSSSSCSSSFSSIDQYNRTAQSEASSFNQPIFPETPTRPMNKPNNAPLQLSQRSPDIRYVVKDSIYRDARALSVKTAGKEEAVVSRTLVYIDSPRPLQPPKPVKPRASGLDDSFRILAKPRNYQEEKDGRMRSSLKDAPRLSYDGRLSQDACKSTIKLKELPRLSLDSRGGSIGGSASETKSSFLVKDLQRRNGNSSKMLSQQQEPESTPRPSSVVAKLMGLEAFPQSTSPSENPSGIISSCRTEKSFSFSKASKTDGNKQNQISGFPRNSHKDPTLDRLKNVESVMRPTSASRFPTELAPWRQPDGSRGSQQTAFKYEEGTPKASNSSLSVYGEIEQRLAKLEFKKSGRDLRALKQILEAMQKTKEALDTKREQAPNFGSQTSNSSSSHQNSNLASPRKLQNKDPISSTVKGSHSPKSYKSPAVIMKPVNLIRRTCDHASNIIPAESMSGLCKPGDTADWRKVGMRTAKDLTPRSNHLKDHFSPLSCSTDKRTHARTSKSTSALKVPGHIIGEKYTSSVTVSPRLQQRNFRLQQQSPHTISSSDSSKTISQCTRQPTGRKIRLKSHSLQQCNDQLRKTSSDMRDLSHQGDTISLQSESSISSSSHIGTEVTSTNQSDKINTTFFQQYCQKQENPEGFGKDRSMLEPAIATLEQPSPVSVLDATFYRDESPSPVKKISNAFQDYEPDEGEWNPRDLAQLQKTRQPRFSADIDDKKLESTQHLVQNLQQINCTEEDPIINYIAPLQEGTNSDHRYISEILLASGLLRDLDSGTMTVQLQVSGYPINYNVLLALEQTKASAGLLNDKQSDKRIIKSEPAEKIQRLLIFDIVNEILDRKLQLEGPPQQWFSPNKLPGRKTRGQQLLEELCSEVDQLQNIIWEDLMHQSMDWTDCHSEIPGVVLDVERLIFKDLITEVVHSERIGRQGRPGRLCRKLLSM
ncbi:protein LONGIFOLIA 2-like [Corylus avellana]|uniref:protein LONGIFOLIA 2-like n=1 Tax=Corylus avellana TaxID=13451 RepID=UPI001E1FB7EE|nr:protein LONGIFOLIA 2-like [Corylus avellana]XP_059450552.1 protein LONGIFOLIA 2-like [Corylus avellana]